MAAVASLCDAQMRIICREITHACSNTRLPTTTAVPTQLRATATHKLHTHKTVSNHPNAGSCQPRPPSHSGHGQAPPPKQTHTHTCTPRQMPRHCTTVCVCVCMCTYVCESVGHCRVKRTTTWRSPCTLDNSTGQQQQQQTVMHSNVRICQGTICTQPALSALQPLKTSALCARCQSAVGRFASEVADNPHTTPHE